MSEIETLLENLSPKQEAILQEFREKVQDILKPDDDDFFLLRWLKARNFDIDKSEQMLRKSMEWRKNYGTDDILNWDPPEVLKKYWPGGIFGFDKHGHPILWQMSTNFDARGMLKSVKRSDVIKYHIWRMEKLSSLCREQSTKLGRRIACAVHVSDLTGFSLKMVFTPGIPDMMKEVFALIEANYPENLYSSIVINVPSTFVIFFNILRPFLSDSTKRKVHVCGRNWRERLLAVADPEQIPAYWGGTAKYPDDLCTDYINPCAKIPPEYYIQDRVTVNKESMTKITVPRGGTHQLSFNVTDPGTVIRWVFETDHYDIAYGIFLKLDTNDTSKVEEKTKSSGNKNDSMEEIKPVSRVNSQMVPEDGNITCTKTGTYIFQFNNNYSWVHSKTVYYEVEVLPPVSDPVVFKDVSLEEEQVLETTYL